ncbi:MAG: hypothetical protein MZV63_24020 [Marinilabiliales bacterium]|nr:hypothetical protein [Marinilabiliales bacterium]
MADTAAACAPPEVAHGRWTPVDCPETRSAARAGVPPSAREPRVPGGGGGVGRRRAAGHRARAAGRVAVALRHGGVSRRPPARRRQPRLRRAPREVPAVGARRLEGVRRRAARRSASTSARVYAPDGDAHVRLPLHGRAGATGSRSR